MAVAVCYHARLQERTDFEIFIIKYLQKIHDRKQFLDEIVRYMHLLKLCMIYWLLFYLVGVRACSYVR